MNRDNGYRHASINAGVAGMVGKSVAGAFGEVERGGREMLEQGLKLQAMENDLRDDEQMRVGMREVREAIGKAAAEIERGVSWQEAVKKQKDGLEEREFMGVEGKQKFRWASEGAWAEAEEKFEAEARARALARAKAAYNEDIEEAIASGDVGKFSEVVRSGVGRYITPKQARRMEEKYLKDVKKNELMSLIKQNPVAANERLEAGEYDEYLTVSDRKAASEGIGMELGVRGGGVVRFKFEEEAEEDEERGKRGSVKSKKEKYKSGERSAMGDLVEVLRAGGREVTSEELNAVAMEEVEAYEVSGVAERGGMESEEVQGWLGEKKKEWKEYGISEEWQKAMEARLGTRIGMWGMGGGDVPYVDISELMGRLSKSEDYYLESDKEAIEAAARAEETAEAKHKEKPKKDAYKAEYEAAKKARLKIEGEAAGRAKENELAVKLAWEEWVYRNPKAKKVEQVKNLRRIIHERTGAEVDVLDMALAMSKKNAMELSREREKQVKARAAIEGRRKLVGKAREVVAAKAGEAKKEEISSDQVHVEVVSKNVGGVDVDKEDAFIIGRGYLKRYGDYFKKHYEPEVKIKTSRGTVYRAGKVVVVDGDVFGVTRRAWLNGGYSKYRPLIGQIVMEFVGEEEAVAEGRKKLFGNKE